MIGFVIRFGVWLGLFYATYLGVADSRPFDRYLGMNAKAAGAVLALLEQDVQILDQVIRSPAFSVKVVRGCEGLEPIGMFASAVMAAPVGLSSRLAGVLIGSVCLLAVNLMRIVTLVLAQIHIPEVADVLHYEIWQAILLVLAALAWVLWIRWAATVETKR